MTSWSRKNPIENSPGSGNAHQTGVTTTEIGVSKEICSIAFLADGRHIVGGGYGGKVRVWQTADGEGVGAAMDARSTVLDITVSRDGKWVVCGTGNGRVIVWNAELHEKITEFDGHGDWVRAVDVSPDTTRIASGSDDKTACIWSIWSGERLLGPFEHDYVLAAVKFSPNGDLLATATWWKESVRVYDSRNGCLLIDFPVRVTSYENQSLAWSFNSTLFALSFDGDIKYCDVSAGTMHSHWPIRADGTNTISYFPNDLTSHVKRDGRDPVTSGGFADIYRGMLQTNWESIKVAIKAIRTYSAEDGNFFKKQKRLRREINIWLTLKHVNILPLLGTTTGFGRFPAMVCPWVDNGSLTAYLEDCHDKLSVVEILTLLNDAASGLQYLFATSVHAKGTLRWTAPELLDLRISEDEAEPSVITPTKHSDVYSFGGVMLQVLTGKVPYHYYTREAQVLHAVSRGMAPKRPSSALVTERRWMFIQWCWSTVDAFQSRPSGEDIVEFTNNELAEIIAQ
ncbi:WD40-repeat-containing domain protein [Lanmaoa asiatica]|nr:WD40-repeat-containing domain protein [Lanmaoa asiatica]